MTLGSHDQSNKQALTWSNSIIIFVPTATSLRGEKSKETKNMLFPSLCVFFRKRMREKKEEEMERENGRYIDYKRIGMCDDLFEKE